MTDASIHCVIHMGYLYLKTIFPSAMKPKVIKQQRAEVGVCDRGTDTQGAPQSAGGSLCRQMSLSASLQKTK